MRLDYEKLSEILSQTHIQEIYSLIDLLKKLGFNINIMPTV